MTEETGWTEPFRVRFPSVVEPILRELADREFRSVPSMIQVLTIEALSKRYAEKQVPLVKDSIMRGQWKEKI